MPDLAMQILKNALVYKPKFDIVHGFTKTLSWYVTSSKDSIELKNYV